MPRLDDCHELLVQSLTDHYSLTRPAAADPAATLFERLAAVLLDRVATPKMATLAQESLGDAGMLDPVALAAAHPLELDDIFKQDRVVMALKSLRPLQKLARWASEQVGTFDQSTLAARSTEAIRAEWRAINGVGLATADALLLLGLGRLSYPVDRATYRIFVRHGWLDPTAEYDEAREQVERLAVLATEASNADTAALLIQFGVWFERLGRDFCKPALARCDHCPLRSCLPTGGPVAVE